MTYPTRPYNALNELYRELSRVFDTREPAAMSANHWTPHVDITESETAYNVVADLPGVKPEEVEVSLHNNVLTIRGERDTDETSEDGEYKRRERFRGTFFRQFTLPEQTDEDAISAKANHGVLEIEIPKGTKAKPVNIKVNES